MNRYAPLIVGALVVFGALVGVYVSRNPGMADLVVPPFWWPLFAMLALDLATRPAVMAGRLADLSMAYRAIAVIAGALAYQVVRMLLATP
jgi:hypothetical protein